MTRNQRAQIESVGCLLFIGFFFLLAFISGGKGDPDKRSVELRMKELYGVSFEVLGTEQHYGKYDAWYLRSSDGVDCRVVQCRDKVGRKRVWRSYDTYCFERVRDSDAFQTLDKLSNVNIAYTGWLEGGAQDDELPFYAWSVSVNGNANNIKDVYALIEEAIASAEMSAADIYRTEYWRSMPPVFLVRKESSGEETVMTLPDMTE